MLEHIGKTLDSVQSKFVGRILDLHIISRLKPFCLAPPGASLHGAIPRVPPKLSQYRGSEGSTSFAQRTMPPSSEYKRAGSRPSSTSDSHAAAERIPA